MDYKAHLNTSEQDGVKAAAGQLSMLEVGIVGQQGGPGTQLAPASWEPVQLPTPTPRLKLAPREVCSGELGFPECLQLLGGGGAKWTSGTCSSGPQLTPAGLCPSSLPWRQWLPPPPCQGSDLWAGSSCET